MRWSSGFAKEGFKEVIMATNPTIEGDGTALHISNLLAGFPVRITRLARGITTGSVLEFANKEILADALTGRQSFIGERGERRGERGEKKGR